VGYFITYIIKNLNLKYRFVKNMNMKQELIKLISRKNKDKKIKEVWALKDISFSIEKGMTVGIIGTNGSGKTTLLKTIANIFKPDSGTLSLASDSVALLTLGAGFQPELSGYENIYLNGLLLGFNKKEITERLEEITNPDFKLIRLRSSSRLQLLPCARRVRGRPSGASRCQPQRRSPAR